MPPEPIRRAVLATHLNLDVAPMASLQPKATTLKAVPTAHLQSLDAAPISSLLPVAQMLEDVGVLDRNMDVVLMEKLRLPGRNSKDAMRFRGSTAICPSQVEPASRISPSSGSLTWSMAAALDSGLRIAEMKITAMEIGSTIRGNARPIASSLLGREGAICLRFRDLARATPQNGTLIDSGTNASSSPMEDAWAIPTISILA